jgi:hypothetical protein
MVTAICPPSAESKIITPLLALSRILASHHLLHTAEAEFFRNAARKACERLKIPVMAIRDRDLDKRAKLAFGDDVYNTLLSKTESQPEALAKIKADQKAWLVYRDTYVAAMYPAKINKRRTAQRIQ